jgi:drug/metabolite transporter (DMT)-like permease
VAALAVTTYGVQYLVLAWWFNGEKIAPLEWLGVACCFAGCIIVSPQLSLDDNITRGMAVGLFSALLYAALPLLHQRASDIGTTERSWGQFFFALLLFAPLWYQSDWQLRRVDWYQLLVLGVVCTVVAHGLWVKASTELPALYTSMAYYLYLPLAMIYSAAFLGEAMTTQKLLGAALVIGSSVALSLYRYRRVAAAQRGA